MLKVINGGKKPTKGSKYSACIDLYANEDVVIGAGETVLVGLGIKIDLDKLRMTYYGKMAFEVKMNAETYNIYFPLMWEKFKKSHQLNLHIRSSMSAKHGLIIANGTGIIDLDYENEIKICLHNPITGICFDRCGNLVSKTIGERKLSKAYIKKGQPIAQISLVEHKSYLFGVESKDERTGGFGSTDA